jgi:hypothetical protein
MDQVKRWGLSRYGALVLVLAIHAVLLVLFLTASDPPPEVAEILPIELLYLPPPKVPTIRAEISRPKRLTADTALSIVPPVLDSILPAPLASASLSDGDGQGVDWKAEARRAVQAFEIRTREPVDYAGLAGSPAEEHWWPRAQRRSGVPFKTPNGDWIVWVNERCYQVASSSSRGFAVGALLPPTICNEPARSAGRGTTN